VRRETVSGSASARAPRAGVGRRAPQPAPTPGPVSELLRSAAGALDAAKHAARNTHRAA
jgi:hypothetical protein